MPSSESDLFRQVDDWIRAEARPTLGPASVPGATITERQALAAIGGIAADLAGGRVEDEWPRDVRRWAMAAPRPPQALISELRKRIGGEPDVLALLYEHLVSGRSRRRLGTFFTPPDVVEFMLDRAAVLMAEPESVVDPGAGVGAFALAAARRWPKARLICVDVNVVTLGLLAARAPKNVELVHDDFLTWAGAEDRSSGPRLWIGNPPYTRHHELTAEQKEQAIEASRGLVKSRLAGLSAYFLAVSLRAMRKEDSLCFLLPANWTNARYGRHLRRRLSDLSDRRLEFYGFESDIDVFPGTRVAAMIALVGPTRAAKGEAPSLVTATARLGATGVETREPVARRRAQIEDLGVWLWPRARATTSDAMRIRDVARVRRGVATGANNYFLLSDKARRGFPKGTTLPILRRLRYVDGDRVTPEVLAKLAADGERCWLVSISDPTALEDPVVADWIERATADAVLKRYLVRHRDPWYQVEKVEAPDIIVSPMGKLRLRAVANDAGVLIANSLYGIYVGGDRPFAARLVQWLNGPAGQAALKERARVYGSGLLKLEPRDLGAVWIPKGLVDRPDASG